MRLAAAILLLAKDTEERVNITPVLMRFIGKFFLIFAAVAVIAVLTPRMAKWIDNLRAKHEKPAQPEDPRCKAVRGPYDMPEPKKSADGQPVRKKKKRPDGEPVRKKRPDGEPVRKKRPDDQRKRRPRPKPPQDDALQDESTKP